MTVTQWATTLLGGVGGLAGVGALLNAFFGRGKTRAEATQIITGSAVSMMTEFEADARTARAETAQVRTEMRAEMRAVRDEARALAEELHRLRMAIMQPGASVDSLRVLVSGAGTNGRTP